jgi:hypothetical protein
VARYLRQAKLKDLAVALDQDEGMLRSYRGESGSTSIPYAAVTNASGRVLWAGPVVDPSSRESPLARFGRVVEEAAGGRFDLAAARRAEVRQRELAALPEELAQLISQDEMEEFTARVKAAQQSARADDPPDLLMEALARTGWMLLQEEPLAADRAALSLGLIEASMAVGNAARFDILHLHAQALFATGQIEAAVAEEEKAVATAPPVGSVLNQSDCRQALARYQRALAEKRGEPAPSEPAPPPEPPVPATLTREQAQQDLRALDEELRQGYAAYDDTAWALAAKGSSWHEYHRAALDRLGAQAEWPHADFARFVNDYLAVCQDRHLTIEVRSPEGQQSPLRPMPGAAPYFADVRVQAEGNRMVVAEASDSTLIGREVVGAPIIDGPVTVRLDKTYLFPTLPPQSGRRDYLVGVLSADKTETVMVALTGTAPRTEKLQAVALPAHRGRALLRYHDRGEFEKAPPWSLTLDPLPVLTVRRMWGDGLEGMAETATKLRDLPAVVLDLRANGGGSDVYAAQWGRRFTDEQPRIYEGWASIQRGETDPLLRWQSCYWNWQVRVPEAATKPYGGRLFALIDNGTCSSGESFAIVAAGIRGALLLGENSGGFGTYGNVDHRFTLPNSRLTVVYGGTKFAAAGRPFREGLGLFPDYWLDTDDPVKAISDFLGRCSASASPR